MNETPAHVPGGKRRHILALTLGLALVAGTAYGSYWYFYGRYIESTEDAYVSGDIVQVSSAVAGIVTAVNVDDTQNVTRGSTLVELDPANAILERDRAEAELARAVRRVRAEIAEAGQAEARSRELGVALHQAEDDLARRRNLVEQGAIGGEELSHLQQGIDSLHAQLDAAAAQIAASRAAVDHTTLEQHPDVLAAATGVREAALNLRRTRVQAVVDGTVAMRGVQVGAQIAAGAPLLAIVPLQGVWVEANFKETQLQHMRINQPVRLSSDLYGSHQQYHGRIAGLAAGSGSAFALIPPQNASGNWIKIVQRVPVRVLIDPAELAARPLRQGLSMSVEVDTHDENGPLVAGSVRNFPTPRRDTDGDDPLIAARIHQIIAANAGAEANLAPGQGLAHLSRPIMGGKQRS